MSFYERQSANLPESTRLFFLIQIRDTQSFISLAKTANVELIGLKNQHGQTLMHVCAVMGNLEIAEYLVHIGCLGTERDVGPV